jgi:hypothetical protein
VLPRRAPKESDKRVLEPQDEAQNEAGRSRLSRDETA